MGHEQEGGRRVWLECTEGQMEEQVQQQVMVKSATERSVGAGSGVASPLMEVMGQCEDISVESVTTSVIHQ